MAALRDFKSWTGKQAAPATMIIIALMVISSIYFWFVHQRGMELLMHTSDWTSRPWQLITHPFGYTGLNNGLTLIFFVMLIAWMVMAGFSIEKEIGPYKMAAVWIVGSIAPALLIGLWGMVRQVPFAYGGPFLPAEAITIVWCTRNATAGIMAYGFIPLSGKWLAWLTVATVIFLYGAMMPTDFGFVAAVSLIIPYLFARNKIPFFLYDEGYRVNMKAAKATERRDKGYFDDVRRREQERAEREKLRKLFEGSMKDDDDK